MPPYLSTCPSSKALAEAISLKPYPTETTGICRTKARQSPGTLASELLRPPDQPPTQNLSQSMSSTLSAVHPKRCAAKKLLGVQLPNIVNPLSISASLCATVRRHEQREGMFGRLQRRAS